MTADLTQAKQLLLSGGHTCVLCRNGHIITDDRRGIKPLLELLESGADLRGCHAADKVVGKAAAFLYCLLGAAEVYAGIISTPALAVLESHGIAVTWDQEVSAIQNRTHTGLCPMEQAVWTLCDPAQAPEAIHTALTALSQT